MERSKFGARGTRWTGHNAAPPRLLACTGKQRRWPRNTSHEAAGDAAGLAMLPAGLAAGLAMLPAGLAAGLASAGLAASEGAAEAEASGEEAGVVSWDFLQAIAAKNIEMKARIRTLRITSSLFSQYVDQQRSARKRYYDNLHTLSAQAGSLRGDGISESS
jgi:hypothetical protein